MESRNLEMEEKPTAEIEARGLKAYEQARAYERLRAWRLPLTYALAPIGLLLLAVAAWWRGQSWLAAVSVGVALFVSVRLWMEWRRLRQLYEDNLVLLTKLEASYGDALPWVEVENHFAALEELKREIAEGKAKS
jgi:hypothetical protein